jgi:ubiquinone/menaquinone biosynthesis C-methylase UbiE
MMDAAAKYTLRDQELMKAARRYFAWQAKLVRRELGRRVIEVGCGVGNFTRHLLDRELVVALDVEAGCLERLRRDLGNPANLICRELDVSDADFLSLREHSVDSVVCLNVLEHVRDDLGALRNMASVLPRGGKAVLIVPAFEGLYGPIDRNVGHYRRYSKNGLRALAAAAGFEARVRYMNSVGFVGWWVNARVFKKSVQSERQIAIFDRFVVPPLAWVEGIAEPPFGQSILGVLTRT